MREILEVLHCDFTEDIIIEWDAYIEDGCSVQEVTDQILEQYSEMLEETENMILYLSLFILQLEEKHIEKRIKDEVKEMIGTQKLEDLIGNDTNNKVFMQLLKNKCK